MSATEEQEITTILAFIHHLAAFTLAASLAVEFALLRTEFSVLGARALRLADAVFGMSAGLVLIVGGLRVFYFEKGSDYYFSSPYFLAKLALFVGIGLLSIIPTRTYLSWGPALRKSALPMLAADEIGKLRLIVNLELAAVAAILLCAAAAARGGLV